jgi:hypothetical protein
MKPFIRGRSARRHTGTSKQFSTHSPPEFVYAVVNLMPALKNCGSTTIIPESGNPETFGPEVGL